jgi:hypothetical protein
MQRFLGSLVLGFGLLAPVGTLHAQDNDRHDKVEKAHEWNDSENPAWHQYLKEHHIKDHDWDKAKKREQTNYWKWRDKHPDAH